MPLNVATWGRRLYLLSEGSRAGFVSPLAVFASANLGSSGEYANYYTTEAA